jgi:hypothetical protein
MKAFLVNFAISLLGLAPTAVSFGARLLASHLGCTLDDTTIHPCAFQGADIGRELYAGGMAWMASIVTVPLALTLIVVYNIFRRARRA